MSWFHPRRRNCVVQITPLCISWCKQHKNEKCMCACNNTFQEYLKFPDDSVIVFKFRSFADEASWAADHPLNFIKGNQRRASKKSITIMKPRENKRGNESFGGLKERYSRIYWTHPPNLPFLDIGNFMCLWVWVRYDPLHTFKVKLFDLTFQINRSLPEPRVVAAYDILRNVRYWGRLGGRIRIAIYIWMTPSRYSQQSARSEN